MPAHIMDGFQQYASSAEMAQKWGSMAADTAIYYGGTPGVARVRAASNALPRPIHRGFQASSKVCASFLMHVEGTGTSALSFGVSPAGYHDRATNNDLIPLRAIRMDYQGGSDIKVYYDIATSASGKSSNSLLVGTIPALVSGIATHHFEFEVDHSEPIATLKIAINGAIVLDVSYVRDRLTNGYEALEFASILFSAYYQGGASFLTTISNVIVYQDDAEFAFPMGRMDVKYAIPANANLSIGPSNDATGVTLSDNAWTEFQLSDVAQGTRPIGASLIYRVGASNGQAQADAEVGVEMNGSAVHTSQQVVTPGLAYKLFEFDLGGRTESELNSAVIKMRSARSAS